MAGRDVVLRVRLDTSQGKRDLAAMFGGGGGGLPGAGSPGVAGRPGGVGAGAPVAGTGAGPVGGGGFALGPILAKLAAAVAGLSLIGGAAPRLGRDAIVDEARSLLLGKGQLGAARGIIAARDAVASRFGFAYGQGLVGEDTLKQQLGFEMQAGAGAEAKGQAGARAALSSEVLAQLKSVLGEVLKEELGILGDAIDGVKRLMP